MAPTAAALAKTISNSVVNVSPEFIKSMNNDYRAQIAHIFLLQGNIYDFCDSKDLSLSKVFTTEYDDAFRKDLSAEAAKDKIDPGLQVSKSKVKVTRIILTYSLSQGLKFPHINSEKLFTGMMLEKYGESVKVLPTSVDKLLSYMNLWFELTKERTLQNKLEVEKNKENASLKEEVLATWIIEGAEKIFPNGDIAMLNPTLVRAIDALQKWSQDELLAVRNRIILVTKHVSDMHASVRSEVATVHTIRKPNLVDRLAYIKGFEENIARRAKMAGGVISISDNNKVSGIPWAVDFDAEQCAIQSAGMNRRNLKDVFLEAWISQTNVDYSMVIRRKQRALLDEYQGRIDFKEPTFGFEEVGGHDHFKEYCVRNVITPLKTGDIKTCSRGALMTGPPGTGKSILAMALAKEAKLNFMTVDLGKVFAGIVGETEKNMRQLIEAIEAASPCIVFIDEIDSVLSAGRSSSGDSGTSGRVFNSFMTFMSDPGRVGRIVVLAASNRPDMLDKALIRPGRFDAKIPILPPAKTDFKGRTQILQALITKHKVAFGKELQSTMKDVNNGLGRLLMDSDRMWTGAEIESLIKKALTRAAYADRVTASGAKDYTIKAEDWNHAMNVILPNTGDVEVQIALACEYVDDLDWCPPAYWEQVKVEQEKATARKAAQMQEAS